MSRATSRATSRAPPLHNLSLSPEGQRVLSAWTDEFGKPDTPRRKPAAPGPRRRVPLARIRRWWKPRKQRLAEIEKPSERAIARGRYKEKFAAAVASGKLVTSRDAFITPAVIAELDQRGWNGPTTRFRWPRAGPGDAGDRPTSRAGAGQGRE